MRWSLQLVDMFPTTYEVDIFPTTYVSKFIATTHIECVLSDEEVITLTHTVKEEKIWKSFQK